MYFDTAYIVKCYLEEPESPAVRALVGSAQPAYSSIWALTEVHCVFHRCLREGAITLAEARDLARTFLEHVNEGFWNLIPAGEPFLRRVAGLALSAPPNLFLRTVDAVHLVTALELGEGEIWTNDRHMLAAAPHFGLIGQSV